MMHVSVVSFAGGFAWLDIDLKGAYTGAVWRFRHGAAADVAVPWGLPVT